MLYQHYLGNNKSTFLAYNPELVYAATLEFEKNNDLFQNHKTYSRQILEISLNFLHMVSAWLQVMGKGRQEDRTTKKTSKNGRHLL